MMNTAGSEQLVSDHVSTVSRGSSFRTTKCKEIEAPQGGGGACL